MIVFYHQEKCTNCTDHHLFQSRIHVSKSAFMKQAMLTIFSTSRPAVLFGRTSNGGGGENEENPSARWGAITLLDSQASPRTWTYEALPPRNQSSEFCRRIESS